MQETEIEEALDETVLETAIRQEDLQQRRNDEAKRDENGDPSLSTTLALLKIGQPVSFGVSADDRPFKGTIRGIEPKVDPSSRLV